MNYLAHAVFTDGPGDVLFGAMMCDRLANKRDKLLPEETKNGIKLHLDLDSFFNHELLEMSQSRRQLSKIVRHFWDPVLDMCCDHIIVSRWNTLFNNRIEDYLDKIYPILKERESFLSDDNKDIIQKIIEKDWLVSYGNINELDRVLTTRIAEKSLWGKIVQNNIKEIKEAVPLMEKEFLTAIPVIRKYTQDQMKNLGYQPEGRILWREKFLL